MDRELTQAQRLEALRLIKEIASGETKLEPMKKGQVIATLENNQIVVEGKVLTLEQYREKCKNARVVVQIVSSREDIDVWDAFKKTD